jgi:hypothetical protein
MKIIDVPLFKEDGSINAMVAISPQEAQVLLAFALNFMAAHGIAVGMSKPAELND